MQKKKDNIKNSDGLFWKCILRWTWCRYLVFACSSHFWGKQPAHVREWDTYLGSYYLWKHQSTFSDLLQTNRHGLVFWEIFDRGRFCGSALRPKIPKRKSLSFDSKIFSCSFSHLGTKSCAPLFQNSGVVPERAWGWLWQP